MKEYKEDTSANYDDMVDFIAEENITKTLGSFIGHEEEYKPTVKPKNLDPNFPEDWQNLYVNFSSEKEYIEFMQLLNKVPGPKVKSFVYEPEDDKGILGFLGD